MVSLFLSSVAQLLRKLVSEGRAIHVTEADAVELEMLAGLFEQHGLVRCSALERGSFSDQDLADYVTKKTDALIPREIIPADFALGLLLSSRAQLSGVGRYAEISDGAARRAAVCAELALLSEHAEEWRTVHPDGRVEEFPGHVRVHAGTIEGARAAWSFVVDKLGEEIDAGPCSIKDLEVRHPMVEKYRRELEAMR